MVRETHTCAIGDRVPDFELPGVDGEVYHLSPYRQKFQAIGVIFMCNHCPEVRYYLGRLQQIQAEFAGQGFTLMGINANDADRFPEDSFENMKCFAAEKQFAFPYLRDSSQDVARGFGASSTPEVFLIDRDGRLRYRGAIDDSLDDSAVQQPYFRQAIAALLSNAEIVPSVTNAVGCALKWRE